MIVGGSVTEGDTATSRGEGGGAFVAVLPDGSCATHRAAACAIEGMVESAASSSRPDPHCAATLSSGGVAFGWPGGNAPVDLGDDDDDDKEEGHGVDREVGDANFDVPA